MHFLESHQNQSLKKEHIPKETLTNNKKKTRLNKKISKVNGIINNEK